MRMTIRLKMMAVVAVIGARGMQGINHDLNELFEQDFKLAEAVNEVFIESLEAEVLLLEVAEAEDAATQNRHIEELNEQVVLVEEHLADIGGMVRNDAEREFLARMEEDFLQFEDEIETVEHFVAAGDHSAAAHAIETEVNVTFADLKIVIGEFIHELEADAEAKKQSADASAASSTQLLVIIAIAATAMSMAIAWLLSSSISRRSVKIQDGLTALADGDLTVEVNVSGSDELGSMGDSFRTMIANLRTVLGQVQTAASSVSGSSGQLAENSSQSGAATQQMAAAIQNVATGTAAQTDSLSKASEGVGQLSDASQSVASGSQNQARQISDTQRIMERMVESIDQVASNSQAVVSASADAESAAKDGSDAVERTVETMDNISTTVSDAANLINDLGTRSEEIGNIVSVINDIADQTNLLALNAAIEAARAGEAGRGFAVVAEEVRKLAERTTQATAEIVELVRSVQEGTTEAISGITKGSDQVDAGGKVVAEAGNSLRAIQEAVDVTASQIKQIDTAAKELATSSTEVETAITEVMSVVEQNSSAAEEMAGQAGDLTASIGDIASVSEENSASAEEVSASIEELSSQVEEMAASAQELDALAEELGQVAGKFKLDGESAAKDRKPIEHEYAPIATVAPTNGASDSTRLTEVAVSSER